jgi:hypothetical protein
LPRVSDYHVLNNLLRERDDWRAGGAVAVSPAMEPSGLCRGASANATAFEHYVDGLAKVFYWVDSWFEYAVSGGHRAQRAADRRARGGRAVDPEGITVMRALQHGG